MLTSHLECGSCLPSRRTLSPGGNALARFRTGLFDVTSCRKERHHLAREIVSRQRCLVHYGDLVVTTGALSGPTGPPSPPGNLCLGSLPVRLIVEGDGKKREKGEGKDAGRVRYLSLSIQGLPVLSFCGRSNPTKQGSCAHTQVSSLKKHFSVQARFTQCRACARANLNSGS